MSPRLLAVEDYVLLENLKNAKRLIGIFVQLPSSVQSDAVNGQES